MSNNKGRVVIAGGSGFIGTVVSERLKQSGYEVVILTRKKNTRPGEIHWEPSTGVIDENVLDGALAVINLCGVPLPEKRWTSGFRRVLTESRVTPAHFIGELLRACEAPPECYVGMSAIGIYGDRPTEMISEGDQVADEGFIPDLVKKWESAHLQAGCKRTVLLRTAVVLARESGYLARMLPPSRFGIYPCFGSGQQYVAWIHKHDLAGILIRSIEDANMSGVYNASAPEAVAQKDLMKTLRRVSRRPGILFPVPEFGLRMVFGEMASLLFESARVVPARLLETGFTFEARDIEEALRLEL